MTVTVYVPLGGSTPWRAEGYSAGSLVTLTTGRTTAGPLSASDDEAAVWCVTGPGTAPWVGCGIFDLDGDADVDLLDFALRLRPPPPTPAFAAIDWPLCICGPGITADPECLLLDADGDFDVDLKDWSLR